MNPAKLKLLFITKHLELKDLVPWNVEEYEDIHLVAVDNVWICACDRTS